MAIHSIVSRLGPRSHVWDAKSWAGTKKSQGCEHDQDDQIASWLHVQKKKKNGIGSAAKYKVALQDDCFTC